MSTRRSTKAQRPTSRAGEHCEQHTRDEVDWSPIIAYLQTCAASWSPEAGPTPDERARLAALVTRTVAREKGAADPLMLPADTLAQVLTRTVDVVSRTRAAPTVPAFDDRARLAAALLTGQPAAALARASGTTIATSYFVVALSIPKPDSTHNGSAERNLMRMHDLLAEPARADTLAQLSITGGTVLLPETTAGIRTVEALRSDLSEATGLLLTGAVVTAAPAQVPTAMRDAHQLLDMALALGRTGRIHCFDDLALEYQLCKPGPGREQLLAIIEPLRPYPVFMETLSRYACDGLNRRKLARTMRVHANTVDYRLDRVAQITGHDPRTPAGLSYLRSALLIDAVQNSLDTRHSDTTGESR
ncbi:PucR family transcriptional regulator [Nocardia cerradoensis]|uniref:PucR C-terminal helix-turn-helix domain-containing protein n=1 Tax=Nocardia cerradoensis TaxID=85688 RepID=A0A231GU23_9NOCA|nr:helix-turn-helix domain-containing protein [Nocardia cerradoensis]NKY43730.1 hypothetical protein [Nocardia cerradoensis]OXR40106.1 hypothetical protein B7C42_07814 [Nocardia cerradoensis]